MKKILFYISTIREGGAARVLVNLANAFSASGYPVVLVTNFDGKHEYTFDKVIKRYTLEEQESKSSFLKKNALRCKKLRSIIKSEKADICVSFMRENNFRIIIASLFLRTRKFVSVRNDPDREYPGIINRTLLKLLFPLADGCIMQTSNAQNWLPRSIRKKSQVIMNMTDDKFFRMVRDKNPTGIVTVGRLEKSKNHELLIRAYAEIANMVEDDLFIYGEGGCLEELRKCVEDLGIASRVHFDGYTTKIESVYARAKLFVLPSHYEGMPNTLLEALASGVPSISTDCPCGGPREILGTTNDLGILIPTDDKETLKTAILKILQCPDYAEKLSQNAKVQSHRWSKEQVFSLWETYLLRE